MQKVGLREGGKVDPMFTQENQEAGVRRGRWGKFQWKFMQEGVEGGTFHRKFTLEGGKFRELK